MAIFANAYEVTIVANNGTYVKERKLRNGGESYDVTLVSLKFADDLTGPTFMRVAETLRADDGWTEIKAAIDAAPFVPLTLEKITRELS